MSKEIDYLKKVIADYDISLTWLAKQIGSGWTKQRLYYILNNGKDISVSNYLEIRRVLDKHGFTLKDYDDSSILKLSGNLNIETTELVNDAIKAYEDKVLTDAEKNDLKMDILIIEQRINKLKKVLDMMDNKKSPENNPQS